MRVPSKRNVSVILVTMFLIVAWSLLRTGKDRLYNERVDYRQIVLLGSRLDEAELQRRVRNFYVDVLGKEPSVLEDDPLTSYFGPNRGIRSYVVSCEDGTQSTRVSVESINGFVLDYTNPYPAFEWLSEADEIRLAHERERLRAWGDEITASRVAREIKADIDWGRVFYSVEERAKLEQTRVGYTPKERAEVIEFTSAEEQFKLEWDALTIWKDEYENYPRDKAFERLGPLLKRLGLSLAREDFTINLASKKSNWHFTHAFETNGIPCHGASLQVRVSRYSGKISMIRYRPVMDIPNFPDSPVSKEEALRSAGSWMWKSDRFGWRLFEDEQGRRVRVEYTVDTDNITQAILPPYAYLQLDYLSEAAIGGDKPLQSLYCWRVPFAYADVYEGQYESPGVCVVIVNMETGECIARE